MLFINAEEFFKYASTLTRMTRDEEKHCALCMAQGDLDAREKLIQNYFPQVSGYIQRMPQYLKTLQTVYCCIASLEKGVDSFNFLQDGEPFSHHLSWRLRQCITRCIADTRNPDFSEK